MTLTVSDLGHGQLALAGQSIASSSASAITRVTNCTFYNAHTAAVTVTVYYLRSAESIASTGVLKGKKQIPPSGTWICNEVIGQNIGNSGSLYAVPSTNNVIHYNVSGDAIT